MRRIHQHCLVSLILFLPVLSVLSQVNPEDSTAVEQKPKPKPHVGFWWEFYNESTVLQQFNDNLITSSHVKPGLRISNLFGMTAELYFIGRYGKDLHRDFWNNKTEMGIGLRVKLARKVFIAPYVEWLKGYYGKIPENYPEPPEKEYTDIRSGLLFWFGWDDYESISTFFSFPMLVWGEIYSDVSYYRSQRHNIIGYMHLKCGLHIFRAWKLVMDAYCVFYVMKDSNRDFWNNKAEIGPGIGIKPIPGLDLKFVVEWLFGTYYGIEGVDPNPYPQQYQDRRFGVLFWIGM
jgi:hypothetical protein